MCSLDRRKGEIWPLLNYMCSSRVTNDCQETVLNHLNACWDFSCQNSSIRSPKTEEDCREQEKYIHLGGETKRMIGHGWRKTSRKAEQG